MRNRLYEWVNECVYELLSFTLLPQKRHIHRFISVIVKTTSFSPRSSLWPSELCGVPPGRTDRPRSPPGPGRTAAHNKMDDEVSGLTLLTRG